MPEQLCSAADLISLSDEVIAQDRAGPIRRRDRRGNHAQKRGLAGTVRPANQQHLAALDGQVRREPGRNHPEHAGDTGESHGRRGRP